MTFKNSVVVKKDVNNLLHPQAFQDSVHVGLRIAGDMLIIVISRK